MTQALERSAARTATVRDAAFEVMRSRGMTTIFGNPGSTEIPFLVDVPADIEFVMGLHEGAVVGMAVGYALARERPAFVNLHTAPGLGNAVNALANARDVQAPLVVVVGQQDRKQLALKPFLTGRALEQLAGEYPVWSHLPPRAQDVPGAIARAYNEAITKRGPALVVVPMGDWEEPADALSPIAPERVITANAVDTGQLQPLIDLIDAAQNPAIVTGAGNDTQAGWAATVALAERLRCPVWHEPFSARASFPEGHPQFAGHLDWHRRRMRETLAPHDLVLVLGTAAFKLYVLDEEAPPVAPGTHVAVVTDDPEEAQRSQAELALIAPIAPVCAALAQAVVARASAAAGATIDGGAANPPQPNAQPLFTRPASPRPPHPGEPLSTSHVIDAVAKRIPRDAVLMEEAPSARQEMLDRIPARAPLGWISNGNGGLGFGLAGAIGLRLGKPNRPVVAIVGDGSAMFGIQALWSAGTYEAGVLMIVMANGNYGVMNLQARQRGGKAAWPDFPGLDIAGIARGLGCPAQRIETYEELNTALDEAFTDLAKKRQPLLLEVVIAE